MADPAQALDWYETERANLLAAARGQPPWAGTTSPRRSPSRCGLLPAQPYADDWLAISQIGVSSARQLGDDAVLGWLLNALGQVHGRSGIRGLSPLPVRVPGNPAAHRRPHGEASVLNSLAVDLFYQERFEDALEYMRAALAIYTDLGERPTPPSS